MQKEMRQLLKEPIDGILTTFNPSNILDWHYVIIGPADSPYAGVCGSVCARVYDVMLE